MSGCTIAKYSSDNKGVISDDRNKEFVIEGLRKKNLTNNDFFISRAEIEIITENKKEKFVASIKFNCPDTFLISLRILSGIEAARVFLTKDTILINDRVNRIIYHGSAGSVFKKYGIYHRFFPLFFGDLVTGSLIDFESFECDRNIGKITVSSDNCNIVYNINCDKKKVMSAELSRGKLPEITELFYEDFKKVGYYMIPGSIRVNKLGNFNGINIKMKKIEIPWTGDIEFIPGKNYELKEL